MIMRLLFILVQSAFLLMIEIQLVYADQTTDKLARILSTVNVDDPFIGLFDQERHIKLADITLVSYGEFQWGSATGITYITQSPVKSRIEINSSGTMLDGRPLQDRGLGKFILLVINSILTNNTNDIMNQFAIANLDIKDVDWFVHLEPRKMLIRSVISSIEIKGNTNLHSIVIYEQNGDFTRITYKNK